MRIAKYLAHAGVASRRASEELINQGRVAINGKVLETPAHLVEEGDHVTVNGIPVNQTESTVAYLLDKPSGVVSTVKDPQGRRKVVDLIKDSRRLYPVGRLDIDTTGLILLTNDGELAHRLTHPKFEVSRTYHVKLKPKQISTGKLRMLEKGVQLDDGMTAPAELGRLDNYWVSITLHEGRNRQVKRMFEAVGHRVAELRRVEFGPLSIGKLEPGLYRKLSVPELITLRRSVGL